MYMYVTFIIIIISKIIIIFIVHFNFSTGYSKIEDNDDGKSIKWRKIDDNDEFSF